MKKIRLTIKREVSLEIEFDDTKLRQEWVTNWTHYISDLNKEPDGFSYATVPEDSPDESIRFFNLVEQVGYTVVMNQDDYVEGLQFYPTCYKGIDPKRDAETAVFYKITEDDTEYEFDFDNSQYK